MTPTDLVRCSLKTELRLELPEHQVLLSFESDAGRELFEEWWAQEGQQEFAAWFAEEEPPRDEV